MKKNPKITELTSDKDLRLTQLRQDVLDIFLKSKKPLSAYEALSKLKKKRLTAEPPTVYRVIDYFMQKKLLHRIESDNKYVCCSQLVKSDAKYHGILFICQTCNMSYEFIDKEFLDFITHFTKKNKLAVDDSVIEIKGTCPSCLTTAKKNSQ